MKKVVMVVWVALIVILTLFRVFAPIGLVANGVDTAAGVMQIMISFVLLAAALYVILSKKFDVDTQKWAFGIVGTIVGYWLKP